MPFHIPISSLIILEVQKFTIRGLVNRDIIVYMSIEQVVLVDDDNNPIGTKEKLAAHHRDTPLHRGFSCYVFNEDGELLVTQRALKKKVWPGVWTNTVCGHPGPGEDIIAAIQRRLDYELGMTASDFVEVLPDYRYKTPPFNGVIENELCPVFIARMTTNPKINPNEVAAVQWMRWDDFKTAAEADTGNKYSYWCKDQIKQLKDNKELLRYANA